MTPFQLTRNVRSLSRLKRIAVVLTQHGFGHFVQQLQLTRFLPVWMVPKTARTPPPQEGHSVIGRRLAQVCADLGPTFVKLGQSLATRPGLLPADVRAELRSLQDQVPPFDTAAAMTIIESDLGASIKQCYESIENTPIASGSIGQVYRATGSDGEELIVKVLRPGIEETVRLDMNLLKLLAESIEKYAPELRVFRPATLVDEFEQTLLKELDFLNEAAATERFYAAFKDEPFIHIPKIHWDLCSSRVLTMEALSGTNVETLLQAEDSAIDRRAVASRLLNAYFRQFFDLGFFQADPHPGNILVVPPSTIGLIDFGQVGVISEELMTQFVVVIYAGLNKEVGIMVDAFADMGAFGPQTQRSRLEESLYSLLLKYEGTPLKRIDLSVLVEEASEVMRRCDVSVPREWIMVIKTLATVAGLIERLDPSLDISALLRPRIQEMAWKRLSPARLLRTASVSGWHLFSALRQAPRQVRQLLRQLSAGTWQLNLKHENLDHLITELDRSSNRLAFSIVIAAIIIGSSVVVSTNTDVAPLGIKLQYFGIAGYLIAGILGLGLLWAIYRSGRLH